MFNIEAKDYIGSFYGTNCFWNNNELDSVIYALDNTICDLNGKTICTLDLTETQYISDLKQSDDGASIIVTVNESNSDNSGDAKIYTFDRESSQSD